MRAALAVARGKDVIVILAETAALLSESEKPRKCYAPACCSAAHCCKSRSSAAASRRAFAAAVVTPTQKLDLTGGQFKLSARFAAARNGLS